MSVSATTGAVDYADETPGSGAVCWVPSRRDLLWPIVFWTVQTLTLGGLAFGDHLFVVRALGGTYLVCVLPLLVVSMMGTVQVDADGLSVRYRWLTRCTGVQRRWEWSTIDAVNNATGLTVRIHGRSRQVLPMFFQVSRDRPGLLAFGETVRMRAGTRGIPVLRPGAWAQSRRNTP